MLKHLTPAPDLVAEFMTTVRGAWKGRQGDAEAAYAAIQQRLDHARQRKDKLVDLRIDGDINQATYKEKDERLSTDIEAAEVELRQVESQFLDLEGVLAFAEKIITSPARLWLESSLDQRQRLQQTFFPNGLTFNGEEFGTHLNSSFFSLLKGVSEGESLLASPWTGPGPWGGDPSHLGTRETTSANHQTHHSRHL